ncbi:MAG: DUF4129 domain-containing protein [Thermoplasmata archaeon]
MKRRVANLLILALVLFVAVALINLIQNLQALPDPGSGSGSGGGGPPVLFAVPTLGVNPLILAWVMSLVGVGIFLVAFLYLRPRGGRLGFEEFIPLILGAVLLLAVLFLLQDFRPGTEELMEEPTEEGGTGAGQEPPPAEGPAPLSLFREGLQATPGLLLLFVSFVAFAAIYYLRATLQARRARALGLSIQREQELKREMAEALEERIYRLRLGEDSRSVILGAYRDMVRLFRSYGLPTRRSQTARELEVLALEKLGISGKASRALRRQFEEARYSLHLLTEAKRQGAIESLRRVKSELGA